MTFWQLIRRNLRFHARAHLGVVLGAAIGSAALIGALVVGDSVRESLTDMALRRLGRIHFALSAQDRLFQTSLGRRLSGTWPPSPINVVATRAIYFDPATGSQQSSALALPGVAARQDGTARANRVTVLGVDAANWPLLARWERLLVGGRQSLFTQWKAGECAFLNPALARQLAAREGDLIILRVRKPTALGLDAAISPRNEDTIALRLKVGAILLPQMLGDFSLTTQAAPPANIFLPEELVADKVGVHDRANLLVAASVRASRSAAQGLERRRQRPVPDKLGLPWLNTQFLLSF